MPLADGYSDVPAGKVAFVVTCLEMTSVPPKRPLPPGKGFTLRRVASPTAAWYQDLFRRIGQPWLWFSRLKLSMAELEAIIRHPDVEVFALAVDGRDEGLLELDFRTPGQCELAFFGVTQTLVGHGAGRVLMNHASEAAWRRPIERFWVHTCTGDHPDALAFYMRSGFRPYKRQIEIADDPRLDANSGLPLSAAPHVPVIR